MTPRGDDGWYEAEQPMFQAVVAELQRLKRRARQRLIPIFAISILLTVAFMAWRSRKVTIHEASVVLAVAEGTLAQQHEPMPARELREYVVDILLSDAAVAAIIEKHDLWPIRDKLGMQYAISEFHDSLGIAIHRNYFLYEYSIDSPRSARISIEFAYPDAEVSWEIVHDVADAIIEAQRARTQKLAEEMSAEAKRGLADLSTEATELEGQVAAAGVALARAESDSDPGRLAALRVEHSALHTRLYKLNERIAVLAHQADTERAAAEIVRSGLTMSFDVADETKPLDLGPPPLYFQIILGGVFFCIMLPAVSLFVGAFDTRVHDREDVERLGLPVLGHLPGFPGDAVGSLRARGVARRRVPS